MQIAERQLQFTEVGHIPADWRICSCSELASLITVGIVIRPTQYYAPRGVPALRSANVRETGVNTSDLVFINERAHAMLSKSEVRSGDVLTVRTGYPGTSAVVPPALDGANCIDILITRPGPAVDPAFLAAWINSPHGKLQVLRQQGGLAQQHFNVGELRALLVATPPLGEQIAIVRVLSDLSDLIESLERLIGKKRRIKLGAMQELLTGKRRLPGFEGEWRAAGLLDLFTPLRTASNSRADLVAVGECGYLHYGDVHGHAREVLDCRTELRTYLRPRVAVSVPLMRDGDLVLVDASEDTVGVGKSVEITGLGDRRAIAGLHTILLRPHPDLIARGFAGYIQHIPAFHEALVRVATSSSVYGVSKSALGTVEIEVPETDEQSAIATVLSDMDTEIAALEARLSKARRLKRGMMQQLLTGRIRLV